MFKCLVPILLFIPFVASAQVVINNVRLTVPQMNILYIGVENIIEVSGLNDFSELELKSSTAQISINNRSKTMNQFLVDAGYVGSDTLQLYQFGKLILTRIYENRSIPMPVPQLGDLSDSTAFVIQILRNPTLNIVFPDCYFAPGFRVTKFNLTLIHSAGDTIKKYSITEGFQLLSGQIKAIRKLKTGDKILFTGIITTCPNCMNQILKPYEIVIKE